MTTAYIQEIRHILRDARHRAYSAVNTAMVEAYWKIGERIVVREQQGEARATYGEAVLKELSKALTGEFGKGFSYANLRNFRQFYLTYPDPEKCYTLCSKLTWSHHRLIMRVDDPRAREYYLSEAAEQHWSVRQLERNIDTFYYQRLLSSHNSDRKAVVPKAYHITDFIKDPYVFEFLNIPEPLSASEVDIGQMDMYRRMFDDLQKPESDNPTIGIVLCAGKSETVVKYSILAENKQLFATQFMPYLPTEQELVEQIEASRKELMR